MTAEIIYLTDYRPLERQPKPQSWGVPPTFCDDSWRAEMLKLNGMGE